LRRRLIINIYVPGATRTPDRRLRRPLLYPTELLGQGKSGSMERVKGIEPSPQAWEAGVLPLNYTRTTPFTARNIISYELLKINNRYLPNSSAIVVPKVNRAIIENM
jgi:hypothetical protein